MPCCLIAIATFFPRIVLFVMWLTGYGGRAFDSVMWPLLGFFFMPFTTCFYAIGINTWGDMRGFALALLIVGVVFDLTAHSGGARQAQVRYVTYHSDR